MRQRAGGARSIRQRCRLDSETGMVNVNFRRTNVNSAVLCVLLQITAGGLSCSAPSEDVGDGEQAPELEEVTSELTVQEAAAVERTLTPSRALETPAGVYMTSIEQTSASTGSLAHVVHVYQPDSNGEGIRFEVAARTSTGAVDYSHTIVATSLVSRPGESDQTTSPLQNASGQRTYSIATSRQGWYRFSFTHNAPTGGRTLSVKAYDAAGNPLKMAWSDPPGINSQVRVRFTVTQATDLFFKGGAYRDASPSSSAFADGVRVNGTLLYRRSFDQGRFNFPLGRLNAGQHTLEFSLAASGGTPKYWFGVNDKSFDPLSGKTAWDPVQFLYHGAMRTGDYDTWSDGVAFRQSDMVSGSRPPPVRRGTTFAVALSHSSLNAGNATIRISPLLSPQNELSWAKSLPSGSDYAGGIFVSGSPSTRNREHWQVNVPSDAPVGRYVLRASAPGGAQIGQNVIFYVVHNPYNLVASGAISKAELETYAYDEDDDGMLLQGDYGSDRDNLRDHFTAIYDGNPTIGYWPRTKLTGAFRRTKDETLPSMLDMAAASMDGTTNEFESMLRLYRVVSQRLYYNHPSSADDSANLFIDTGEAMDPSMAFWFSQPNTEYTDQRSSAVCFEYSGVLAALARAAGIPSRSVASWNWIGGWSEHAFTEVYLPGVAKHGGKQTSSNASANSDVDPWYVFDATDPKATDTSFPRSFVRHSEAIAPRAHFGKATTVLRGPSNYPLDLVTTSTTWDPFLTGRINNNPSILNVTAAYTSGPEFWLTSSGVKGWIGYGEKDVYRINKSTTGARAVRVSAVPGSVSSSFDLRLCVGSANNTPVMPDRCANAATSQLLPSGDSYVVVFNDAEDMPARYLRGNVANYVLDLEY